MINEQTSLIQEIQVLREIEKYLVPGAAVFLDLDNTLIQNATPFGSDQWEMFLVREFHKQGITEQEAYARASVLWRSLQHQAEALLVEADSVAFLNMLRQRGHTITGVTARDPELVQATQKQLKALEIQFSPTPSCTLADGIVLSNGVLHCGDASKGVAIEEHLRTVSSSAKTVVLVDDKFRQLKRASADAKNVTLIPLRYAYLDPIVQSYQPDPVTIFLSQSRTEAEALERLKTSVTESR